MPLREEDEVEDGSLEASSGSAGFLPARIDLGPVEHQRRSQHFYVPIMHAGHALWRLLFAQAASVPAGQD